MIFELIKETGWSVEYILSMPARRFFSMKKAMFDIQREDRFIQAMDLCDIQFIAISNTGYYEGLRDYYHQQLNPNIVKKRLNTRTFDMDNDVERKKAADILKATFAQKARLMGLG